MTIEEERIIKTRGGLSCPYCKHNKIKVNAPYRKKTIFVCEKCNKRFTITTNTFANYSHIKTETWQQAYKIIKEEPWTKPYHLAQRINVSAPTASKIMQTLKNNNRQDILNTIGDETIKIQKTKIINGKIERTEI